MRPSRPPPRARGGWAQGGAFQPRSRGQFPRQDFTNQYRGTTYFNDRQPSTAPQAIGWVTLTIGCPNPEQHTAITNFTNRIKSEAQAANKVLQDQPLSLNGPDLDAAVGALGNIAEIRAIKLVVIIDIVGNINPNEIRTTFIGAFGKSITWFTVKCQFLMSASLILNQIGLFCKIFLGGHQPSHPAINHPMPVTGSVQQKPCAETSRFVSPAPVGNQRTGATSARSSVDSPRSSTCQSKPAVPSLAWAILTIGGSRFNGHSRTLIEMITDHLSTSSDRLKDVEPFRLSGLNLESIGNQYEQLVHKTNIVLVVAITIEGEDDYVKSKHARNFLLQRFGRKTTYFTVDENLLNDQADIEESFEIFTDTYKIHLSSFCAVSNDMITDLFTNHTSNCQLSVLPLAVAETINNGSLMARLGQVAPRNDHVDPKLLQICAFIATRTDSKTIVTEFLLNLMSTDFLQNFLDEHLSDLPSLRQSTELVVKGDYVNNMLDIIISSLRSAHKTAVEKLRGQMTSLRLMASMPQLKDSDSIWNVKIQEKIRLMDELRVSPDGKEQQKPKGASCLSTDFRALSIIPSFREMSSSVPPQLQPNRVKGAYDSSEQYLSIQFLLLRLDMIEPLRDAIEQIRKAALSNPNDGNPQDRKVTACIYTKITLQQPVFKKEYMKYLHEATIPTKKANFLKRLQWGSLVCLSHDNFNDSIILALIEDRSQLLTPNNDGKRTIGLWIVQNETHSAVDYGKEYTMCESSAYYEAYKHVLNGLQMFSPDQPIPFERYFVKCETKVDMPGYLQNDPSLDLSCLTQSHQLLANGHIINDLNDDSLYLDAESYLMDESQFAALKLALRSELSLIQGPPGTGKTYLGYKLVQVLLANRLKWSPDETKPILVICYTNHALDQFLEGCLKFIGNRSSLIRVGTRSKSTELEKHNLAAVRNDMALSKSALPKGVFKTFNDHRRVLVKQKEDWQIGHTVLSGAKLGAVPSASTLRDYMGRFGQTLCSNSELAMWLGLPQNYSREISFMPFRVVLDLINQGLDEASAKLAVIECVKFKMNLQQYLEQPERLQNAMKNRSGHQLLNVWLPCEQMMQTAQAVCHQLQSKRVALPCTEHALHMLLQIFGGNVQTVTNILLKQAQNLPNRSNRDRANATQFRAANLSAVDNEAILLDAENNADRIIGDGFDAETDEFAPEEVDEDQIATFHLISDDLLLKLEDATLESQLQLLTNIEPMSDEEYLNVSENQLFKLPIERRWALYRRWVARLETDMAIYLKQLERKQFIKQKELMTARQLCDLHLLKSASLIGMTTTGAAKYQAMLQGLEPPIIIIEEAAEVLEAHLITSLHAKCQQLILIGDHQQLRPKVASQLLENKYKLNISLFERLILNQFPSFATLACQHRMRAVICDTLVRRFYPALENHESVHKYEDIVGVQHNLLFINHNQPEQEEDNRSYFNVHEVDWTEALIKHVLRQGYQPEQVTVLCAYVKQMFEVKARMSAISETYKQVQYNVVDNYQGEENDIVILSFVRSENQRGTIGFLKTANRVCVALSRARKGLFMIGNLDFLARCSPLWKDIQTSLEEIGAVHSGLPISCLEAAHKPFIVNDPKQLNQLSPDGGCQLKCDELFDCGHACSLHCHNQNKDHVDVQCKKPCTRLCDAELHGCKQRCFQDCPPCEEKLAKPLPVCGHLKDMECSVKPLHAMCEMPCARQLKCLHECPSLCGVDCATVKCEVPIKRTLKCGHVATLPCHERDRVQLLKCTQKVTKTWPVCNHSCETECSVDVFESPCPQPCGQPVPDCDHLCQGTCGRCWQGRIHVRCQEDCNRILICGHECKHKCASICQPCTAPCETKCAHSKCATSYAVAKGKNRHCGRECPQCQEPCTWACKHHKCTRKCSEVCNREACNVPCGQWLKCGSKKKPHYCVGVCNGKHYESCPKVVLKDRNGRERTEILCKICHPEQWADVSTVFFGFEDEEDAMFIQLEDCGCIIEYQAMDQFVKSKVEDRDAAIVQLNCPKCSQTVRCSVRYGALLKQRQQDVEKIKKRMEHHYGQKDLHGLRTTLIDALRRLESQLVQNRYDRVTEFRDVEDTLCNIIAKLSRSLVNVDMKHLNVSTLHLNEVYLTLLQTIGNSNTLKFLKEWRAQHSSLWQKQSPKLTEIWKKHFPRCYIVANKTPADNSLVPDRTPDWLFGLSVVRLIAWLKDTQISETIIGQFNEEFQRMELISQLVSISMQSVKTGCDIGDSHVKQVEELFIELFRPVPLSREKFDLLADQMTTVSKLLVKNPAEILRERKEIAKAIGFSRGHWYKCGKCDEIYVIANCGRPMTESRCANCKTVIGGSNHRFAGQEVRADMEMIGENMY